MMHVSICACLALSLCQMVPFQYPSCSFLHRLARLSLDRFVSTTEMCANKIAVLNEHSVGWLNELYD